MRDIKIEGVLYCWYYKERDGNHWYVPKNKDIRFDTKGFLLTPEELKGKYRVD